MLALRETTRDRRATVGRHEPDLEQVGDARRRRKEAIGALKQRSRARIDVARVQFGDVVDCVGDRVRVVSQLSTERLNVVGERGRRAPENIAVLLL